MLKFIKNAFDGLKNVTLEINSFTPSTFDKIGDVTSNLIDFGEDLDGDIITGMKSIADNPSLANAMGAAGDFININSAGNVTSNFAQSTYSTLSTIDYDTVKGQVKSGLSSAWSSIKGAVNSAWD